MDYVELSQTLPSYLVPFISYANFTLFLKVLIGILTATTVFSLLLKVIRLRITLQRKYVFLEAKPVYKTLKSPLSTNHLFKLIHSLNKHASFVERVIKTKNTVSCELIADKEKGIRYILRVPESSVSLIKKTLLSYLPGIEVQVTTDFLSSSVQKLPKNYTLAIRELKLTKTFPLPLDKQENLDQHDPIAYLTGHMTKLQENELAGLQIVYTPVMQRTHGKTQNYINRVKNLLMAGNDISQELYRGKFHKLYSAFVFMVQGEQKQQPSQSRKELYNAVEDKLEEPLFETSIRLFTISKSKDPGLTRMKGLQSSFDAFATAHQSFAVKHIALTKIKNNLLDTVKFHTLKNRLLSYRNNPILSVSELSSIYHLPYTSTTKTEDMVKVRSPKLPSPLPLKSSDNNLDITFARNVYGESETSIGLTLDERRRHMYIIGATGTGKTTALLHMIQQDMQNGKGLAVIDPHGDLTQRLLSVIPQNRLHDVVYFNPYDIERPVSLNVLELPKGLSDAELQREKDLIASSLISIFHKLYPARYSGPRMEHILRNAVLTALELEKPTLETVYKLLTDIKFRKKVVSGLQNGVLKDFWKNEFGKLGSYQKAEQISPITNKLGRFLTTSMTHNILAQMDSKLDFEEVLNSGKILLCDLSKGKIGEDISSFLGSLIVTKIQLAAFRRVIIDEKKRTDFFLYIDEFQNFATSSFAQILSEARKYRLNAILAHQTLAQIEDKDLLKVILANVGSVISFRTSNPSNEDMVLPMFSPEVEKHEIANLPLYSFYMKINAVESMEAFTGEIDDFAVEGSNDVKEAVVERSREKYGSEVKVIHKLQLKTSEKNAKLTSLKSNSKSVI